MFKKFLSSKSSNITISSRTDSGVHAKFNCCDFFMDFPIDKKVFPPKVIVLCLNQYFLRKHYKVKINDCYFVDQKFNSKNHPILREYLYKVRIGNIIDNLLTDENYWNIYTEHKFYSNKYYPHLGRKLNVDKLREICEIFSEKMYDFSNFSKPDPVINYLLDS